MYALRLEPIERGVFSGSSRWHYHCSANVLAARKIRIRLNLSAALE
jgi:hypothetical protein